MKLSRLIAFIAFAVLIAATALWLFYILAERSVVRDAERQSIAWAEYAVHRIPRIEELAQGAAPDADDLRAIAEMETFGQVFLFKLFGPQGAQRFVSDNPVSPEADRRNHSDTAAAVIETLTPDSRVKDGSERPDRPDLYSETYLPVHKDGRVIGAVEVYLDQTEALAATRRDFAVFGLSILTLIILGVASPIVALIIVHRRLRHQNLELEIERERAVSADAAKTEFLANVSHELRTPLNGIVGLAELLEDQELDDDGRELLSVLQSSGCELMTLVNSLLDMTRIESGEARLDCRPFCPASVLHESAVLLEPEVQRKGLVLDVEAISSAVPKVLGDEYAFRQVCLNLLGNAVKFTQAGEVRASLDLVPDVGRSLLLLRVSDTGIGIVDADHDRIFDRFVRTREGLNIGAAGTGLGLSIVRSIVEMMEGQIQLESTPGKGTVFTVRIPTEIAADCAERLVA